MQPARATCREAAVYFEEIRCFPMLKPEEEYALAARWHEHGDRSAAHELLTSHLRLVAKIASRYRGYGLQTSDLISEGNIGLMQALRRFDPGKGVRFSAYAIWWIKAAMQSHVLRSWSLVKIGTTTNQKKLFFNLSKAKRRVLALQEGDLRPDQVSAIAIELGVTERDVVEMNWRLSGDVSLNVPVNQDADLVEWQDRLVEEGCDQESHIAEIEELETRRAALGLALTVLTDRERRIFEARRLVDPPVTLEHLSVELRVSRERVRQIEMHAFRKVQKAAHAVSARRRKSSATDGPSDRVHAIQ